MLAQIVLFRTYLKVQRSEKLSSTEIRKIWFYKRISKPEREIVRLIMRFKTVIHNVIIRGK